jgi:hypothetical protein
MQVPAWSRNPKSWNSVNPQSLLEPWSGATGGFTIAVYRHLGFSPFIGGASSLFYRDYKKGSLEKSHKREADDTRASAEMGHDKGIHLGTHSTQRRQGWPSFSSGKVFMSGCIEVRY